MPTEKPPSKTSDYRRATKPIMEKRRRARINQCLSELKALILDALNEDPSRHSKLEKADILDMTVRHLQNIQRKQVAAAIATDPSVLNKFKAGFNECATEVSRYVSRIDGIDNNLSQRLLNHLGSCVSSLQNTTPYNMANTAAMPSVAFTGVKQSFPDIVHQLQPLGVQIPTGLFTTSSSTNGVAPRTLQTVGMGLDINNNNNAPGPVANNTVSSASFEKLLGGLPLIPSRLPNGDIAFLLPSRCLSSVPGQLLNSLTLDSRSSKPVTFSVSRSSTPTPYCSLSSWDHPKSPAGPSSWDHPTSPPGPRRTASTGSSLSCALSPSVSDSGSDVFNESLMMSPRKLSPSISRHLNDHLSQQDPISSAPKTSTFQNITSTASSGSSNSSFATTAKIGVQSMVENSGSLLIERSFGHISTIASADSFLTNRSSQTGRDGVSSKRDHVGLQSSSSGTNGKVKEAPTSVTPRCPSSIEQSNETVWRPW